MNAGNQPLIDAISGLAVAQGQRAWWTGAHGNAAFSYSHGYAAPLKPSAGRRLRQRLQRHWRAAGETPGWRITELIRPEHRLPSNRPPANRAEFLAWLTGASSGLPAAANPAGSPVVRVDPFRALSVLDVAARIDPVTWRMGTLPRGFARACGAGLVPDEIRLRTRRGGQAWDSWFVARHDGDRYYDLAASVGDTPGLEFIDHVALRHLVESWPWGDVAGPPPQQVNAVNRVLGLALFVDDVRRHPAWRAQQEGTAGPETANGADRGPATPAVIVRSARQPHPDPPRR